MLFMIQHVTQSFKRIHESIYDGIKEKPHYSLEE